MCEKCIELDAKIERYQSISAGTTDQLALDAIKKLTEIWEAEKRALHPEGE
jgi:hypothetical protein